MPTPSSPAKAYFTAALLFLLSAGLACADPGKLAANETAREKRVETKAAPQRRTVHIAEHKSLALDLPGPVRDVVISSPEIAEAIVRTAQQVYLIGLKSGSANAYFIGHDGQQLLVLDVIVERDLTQMRAILKNLMPGSAVRAEPVNGGILLTGTVPSPQDSTRASEIAAQFAGSKDGVLNMLSVAIQPQVLLKVTIAEVSRNAMERLGVDIKRLSAAAGSFGLTGAAETGFAITSAAIPSAALDAVSGVLSAPGAGGAIAAIWQAGGQELQTLIEAMERRGQVRMLAEPVLTSISGETANFLAGGEFPVPLSRDKDEVSIEWKKFGVGLSFTPTVRTEGRIALKIATEVSDLSTDGAVWSNGFSIPALKVRRASSTVELPSGGSLVLAGLISEDVKKTAEGVPGLRQLPVLGRLFESQDFSRSQTELVVIVTPVLEPSSAPGKAPADHALANARRKKAWRAVIAPYTRPPRAANPASLFGFGHDTEWHN